MGTLYYVGMVFIVVFGFVGLIGKLFDISKSAKTELLDNMFESGDIDVATYKKYKKTI